MSGEPIIIVDPDQIQFDHQMKMEMIFRNILGRGGRGQCLLWLGGENFPEKHHHPHFIQLLFRAEYGGRC